MYRKVITHLFIQNNFNAKFLIENQELMTFREVIENMDIVR